MVLTPIGHHVLRMTPSLRALLVLLMVLLKFVFMVFLQKTLSISFFELFGTLDLLHGALNSFSRLDRFSWKY